MALRFGIMIATAMLGACATASANGGAEEAVESVSYETGPCFGACPVYLVTVNADGSGIFEGMRWTAVEGRREFRVTPDQYRAFVGHLEPLRPRQGEVRYSGEACSTMATDLPSVEVKWRSNGGAGQSLYFYYGCDMDRNRAIAERLEKAPDLLPIAHLIRHDQPR